MSASLVGSEMCIRDRLADQAQGGSIAPPVCQALSGRRAEAETTGKVGGPFLIPSTRDPLDGDLLFCSPMLRDDAQEGGMRSAGRLNPGSKARADLD
eukprot:10773953-Alexandrium_andersonii.AAC.1